MLTPARAQTQPEDDGVLVIGRISDDPRRHYEQLRSLIDYVVPRLASVGIREGRVLMARDAQQMASYLRRGRVDWVTETAGMGVNLAERTGAKVLVVTERDGVSAYHSVIFVRRDSGIRSLVDLRGHSIGLQNSSSTSAYLAPVADLLAAGLPMELLLSPVDRPSADSVGYVFAQSENNISTWVHKRLVDAGAYSNLDWGNLHRLPLAYRDDLMVIHQTPDYPRAVEVVRADLDPAVEAALRDVLLRAADDIEGREPLLRFFGTSRFLPIDATMQASLDSLRIGVKRVRAELE
jgi:phosphonate transport system substrate-binding protein